MRKTKEYIYDVQQKIEWSGFKRRAVEIHISTIRAIIKNFQSTSTKFPINKTA